MILSHPLYVDEKNHTLSSRKQTSFLLYCFFSRVEISLEWFHIKIQPLISFQNKKQSSGRTPFLVSDPLRTNKEMLHFKILQAWGGSSMMSHHLRPSWAHCLFMTSLADYDVLAFVKPPHLPAHRTALATNGCSSLGLQWLICLTANPK